jgi:hypothetical protein
MVSANKPRSRQVVTGVSLVIASLSVVAGVALAEGSKSASPEQTPSLSPKGLEDQASYAALEQWLADWDARKESEATTASPSDSQGARPSYSPDPWKNSLGGGAAGDFLYPEKHGFTFESSWTHSDGTHYWGVYSGIGQDSEEGVLLVQRIEPTTMRSTFLRIDTDVQGSLSITGSDGMTISLSSGSGSSFILDVSNFATSDWPSGINHVAAVHEIEW